MVNFTVMVFFFISCGGYKIIIRFDMCRACVCGFVIQGRITGPTIYGTFFTLRTNNRNIFCPATQPPHMHRLISRWHMRKYLLLFPQLNYMLASCLRNAPPQDMYPRASSFLSVPKYMNVYVLKHRMSASI